MSPQLLEENVFERSVDELQGLMENEDGLDDILETAFESYQGDPPLETIEPKQNPIELRKLAKTVKNEVAPKTVLEIGTADGGSLYTWARYFDSVETIISIDKDHTKLDEKFLETFRPGAITCISGRSQDESVAQEVRGIVKDGGIDFILIDGGKQVKEVRKDYQIYRPLLNEGGLIAFHDILTHRDLGIDPDVLKVWQEVRDDGFSYELIEDHQQQKYGYGIMQF